MPRQSRVFVEGGIYHVFSRVTRREPVFANTAEADEFVRLLCDIKARDGFILYAWVLMSNHYHLLLRTVEVPLWRTMASLQVGFTKRFNKAHGLVGPFWQGRYKAKLVDDQGYFDQVLSYVHLNPVTAGLVSDPVGYWYSGHREVVGRTRGQLIDVDEVLIVFGDTRSQARRRYTRALKGARQATWIGETPGRLPWWRWGRKPSEEEALAPRPNLPFIDVLGRSTGMERPKIAAEKAIADGCAVFGVTHDEVTGPSRRRDVVRAREAIALVAVERYAIRLKDIAGEMQKGQDTASRWLSRAAVRRREDAVFAELVKSLDRKLSTGKR